MIESLIISAKVGSATETHPLSNSNNTHNGIFIKTGLTLQQVIRHVYGIHQNVEN